MRLRASVAIPLALSFSACSTGPRYKKDQGGDLRSIRSIVLFVSADTARQKLPPVRHPESLPPRFHEPPPVSAPPLPQALGHDDEPRRPPKSGSLRGTGLR